MIEAYAVGVRSDEREQKLDKKLKKENQPLLQDFGEGDKRYDALAVTVPGLFANNTVQENQKVHTYIHT